MRMLASKNFSSASQHPSFHFGNSALLAMRYTRQFRTPPEPPDPCHEAPTTQGLRSEARLRGAPGERLQRGRPAGKCRMLDPDLWLPRWWILGPSGPVGGPHLS